MREINKIFSILLIMFTITGCNNTQEVSQSKEPASAEELIASIENHEKSLLEESLDQDSGKEEETDQKNLDQEEEGIKKEDVDSSLSEVNTITIKAVGDIMAHKIQNQYAYNKGAGAYDFSDSFIYLKDFISDSDIAIGNYETTTNPNLEYSGFPRFNTPPEFIDAIKKAGFDVLATANNHSLDTELDGLISTIDAIEARGLDYIGTQKDGADRILYKDVDGIKLAFLAYTYGANGRENLIEVREEIPELNYLNDEKIESDIRRAKAKGADFVIVYPHWGIEYQSYPNDRQVELGRDMIEWGADLVIGNHPHVVEPYEYVQASDGRTGFIAYALGNFISFQNLENNNDIRTEQSVAYEIELSKDLASGAKEISDIKAHPIWVGVTHNDYGTSVQNYIATDFLDGGKYYEYADDIKRGRIQKAYDMTLETIDGGIN